MAKKQTAAKAAPKAEVAPVVEAANEMTQVVIEKPKVEAKPKKNHWEVKDRIYNLKGGKKPLSRSVKASNISWFEIVEDGLKISSIILFILDFVSFADKIVILSTKFLNSLTFPGQL